MDEDSKLMLRKILNVVETTLAKVDAMETRVDRLEAKVDHLEAQFTEFRIETRTELKVLSARLDEQRSILAAMVPTRLAAVPSAA